MKVKLIMAVLGVVSVAGLAQASELITYHPFNDTLDAVEGFASPRVYPLDVSITNFAKVGVGSMRFDTTTSRLTFNNDEAVWLSDGPQFTLLFWAYRTSDNLPNPGDTEFFYCDQWDNNLRLLNKDGIDVIHVYAEGDNGVNTSVRPKSPLIPIETWVHIGVQYDLTAKTLDVFINGIQSGDSIDISGFDDVNFGEFRIGPYGTANSFAGLIDDFAVVKGNLTSQEWTDIASGQPVSDVIPPEIPDIIPASIVDWSVASGDIMRMVVNLPLDASRYYLETTTALGDVLWTNTVAHSDNAVNPYVITNLSYSSTDATGTNKVIYINATNAAAFFIVKGE